LPVREAGAARSPPASLPHIWGSGPRGANLYSVRITPPCNGPRLRSVAIPALRSFRDDLHFLLTNRLPRRWATQFVGWFSTIEVGWVRDFSLAAWRLFAPDLDLSDAKKERFDSLHDCFVRELKDGARPVDADPRVVVSPCDAIVGAHGRIEGTQVFQ